MTTARKPHALVIPRRQLAYSRYARCQAENTRGTRRDATRCRVAKGSIPTRRRPLEPTTLETRQMRQ